MTNATRNGVNPMRLLACLAVLYLVAAPCAAVAAEGTALAKFDDWAAYTYGKGKSKTCYIYSVPQKSEGDYSKRNPTYFQVTHRPGDKSFNVVSVTAGYVYKKDSNAEAEVDGTKYSLFTDGDTAWSRDAKGDAALVTAMKNGNQMIVRGSSSRGTLTTDIYSLHGFTAAHAAIDKACGVK
jgi:hypothetical protein